MFPKQKLVLPQTSLLSQDVLEGLFRITSFGQSKFSTWSRVFHVSWNIFRKITSKKSQNPLISKLDLSFCNDMERKTASSVSFRFDDWPPSADTLRLSRCPSPPRGFPQPLANVPPESHPPPTSQKRRPKLGLFGSMALRKQHQHRARPNAPASRRDRRHFTR